MKVFYSWQMDAPRKINKDFIHGALKDAIEKIGQELELSEADRDGIELDQDTQGVLGSPEIARVIFDKISAAQVVVTDVSLVAKGFEDKPHINSNVAIELGYAYGKLGDKGVLKVMNTHFGGASSLPFDLRIRRHPVQYTLEPNADASRIAIERKKLAGVFVDILRRYFDDTTKSSMIVAHSETPFVQQRGRFWDLKETLVPKDDRLRVRSDISSSGRSILYFRCIPLLALPELTAREAYDEVGDVRPLLSFSGYSRARNKWGIISFEGGGSESQLVGATQLFKNREIWGIDLTYSDRITTPDDADETPKHFIPTGAVQREYPRAIDNIRSLAAKLNYGDRYMIEMGLSGAQGIHLAIGNRYFDPFPGPFFDAEVYIRKSITSEYPTGQILNDFWDRLFSELARKVPDELVWKPVE